MSKDKESICVTVRVRPLSNKELEEDSRICLKVDQAANMISMTGLNSQRQAKDFYFDSVCDTNSQQQIFERVGRRSTTYCMQGYNCTIFAYGQTGAGKTYTMMGVNPESRDYHQQRGLVPRTLQHLFECIQKQISEIGVDYIIKCSFVEIYNQQIIDLLGIGSSALNIREDLKKGVYIEGVSEEIISHSDQAMQILRKGSKGRHVGSTFYNQTSSRSHSVFTMQIESQQCSNGIKSTKSRHFHFIDLAGSQRTKKSMGDRLKQGCSINKSLHVLSMVISSLAQVSQGKARHVNYRDSKLTFLLKDSLGGNSKTHLIANISPSFISSLETKSTLMFARKVKLIKVNKVSINQDASGNLQSLKAQIRRLRSQNILLRNGNASLPPIISTGQNSTQLGNNSKMVAVLQQYVDEELQKQTQMQLQITKLNNKNNNLQKGIMHFTENQKQLRMVISIYEDKIKKLKKAESVLLQQVQQLSANDKIDQIKNYFISQRENLLAEVERFKKISQSSSFVKNLLRQIKALKEKQQNEQQQTNLISILSKNNEFLLQIKNSITQLEPEAQQGKASKALIKQNQEIKIKNQELSQRAEKYALQLAEIKDKLDQSQILLGEAISAQINLQKKIQEQSKCYLQKITEKDIKNQKLREEFEKMQMVLKNHISRQNQLQLSLSQYQLENSQLKNQVAVNKDKRQHEDQVLLQKIQNLMSENSRLQENVRRKTQQMQRLKSQNFQIKSQFEKGKEEIEILLSQTSSKLEQYQNSFSKSEKDKVELKNKYEKQIQQINANLMELNKQKLKLNEKYDQACLQIKNYQQQISRQIEVSKSWKQKFELNLRANDEEKKKWEENHNELIKMIQDKKVSDSETQAKLTQSQLQVINLNEKCTELLINYNKCQDNLKYLQSASQTKQTQLQDQLLQKQVQLQRTRQQMLQCKRKLQAYSQEELSLKRQNKMLEEQVNYKQQQYLKLNQELQKNKKKQKQTRILTNDLKNQMYAMKKNYEIQIANSKDILTYKEEQVRKLERENTNLKQSHERNLGQYQKRMENEFQIFKENEGSIKRAMETHLLNKQKRISQLKSACDTFSIQLVQKNKIINEMKEKLEVTNDNLNSLKSRAQILVEQNRQLNTNLTKNEEKLSQIEGDHIRVVEEMQNNFNEELDFKNAEIENLRRQIKSIQTQLVAKAKLQQQLSEAKSQIINAQINNANLQEKNKAFLNEIQNTQNILLTTQNQIKLLRDQLQSTKSHSVESQQRQREIILKLQNQVKLKQAKIQQLQNVQKKQQMEMERVYLLSSNIQKQKSELLLNSQKMLKQKTQNFHKIANELQSKQTENQNMKICLQDQNKKLIKAHQHIIQLQQNLNQLANTRTESSYKIEKLTQEIRRLVLDNKQICHQLESMNHANSQLQNNLNQLDVVLQTKQKEIANLKVHLNGIQSKRQNQQEQFNQHLKKAQQQSAEEVSRLNSLYEEAKQKLQMMRKINEELKERENFSRNTYQMKIQKLETQLKYQTETINRNQNERNFEKQKQEELNKYIDQLSQKLSHLTQIKQRLNEQLQSIKKQADKKVKQSEKRLHLADNQMNSLKQQLRFIQDQATVWKQRMENLQNQIRLSNDRAEKFRMEYMKQKQANKQFKLLLDNAHCQVESFKNEVMDKDKLYHQLLQKVSKNDIERKGLLNQDKKFSDLLQKSRIEVSQFRKKYDDQLKINNLLKQQIQKKEVDVSLVKQRSQEYCRKQQQLLEQIKSDYAKVEAQLKITQQYLNQNKKALKKVTLKNEELQQKVQQLNKECIDAQTHSEELKKQSLKFGIDERQTNYVNRLKEQNTQLKRQLQKANEQVISLNQQKIKLKTDMRNGKDIDIHNLDISKKNSQIKYLQKIVEDALSVLAITIKDYRKPLGQSLKMGIIQLQRELTKAKSEIVQLNDDMNIKNQRIQILENQKLKSSLISKEEDDTLTKMRNKINRTSSTFEAIRQSKQEDKLILQLKDQNKTSMWGLGKP